MGKKLSAKEELSARLLAWGYKPQAIKEILKHVCMKR